MLNKIDRAISDIVKPMEPINNKDLRPIRSTLINDIKVKITFISPMKMVATPLFSILRPIMEYVRK